MKRSSFLTALLTLSFCYIAFAQNAVIKGSIFDAKTKDPILGATILVNDSTGTSSDLDGNYSLSVPPGQYDLTITSISFEPVTKPVNVKNGQIVTMNVGLFEATTQLDVVVVSGSKYERKLTEETVSIEVLDSRLIKNSNSVSLSESIGKVSGVVVNDNQVTIRGGSGYTFGVGSRVLVLIDDIPLVSLDRGEIRWNFIPVEITDQVEVIKSASSALYGANALNGVINVRTTFAKNEPETEVSTYVTFYGKPKRDEINWWKDRPVTQKPHRYGGYVMHKHRFGDHDFIASANYNKSIGFVRLGDSGFRRINLKYRHRNPKVEGLSYGFSANLMESEEFDYFFYDDAITNSYIPFGSTSNSDDGTLIASTRRQVYVDPFLTYRDKSNNRHSLKGRYFMAQINFSSARPVAHQLYGEYQFHRRFNFDMSLTAGAVGQFAKLIDNTDLGVRNFRSGAFYAQIDKKFGRLTTVIGGRIETLALDSTSTTRPVFSGGLNYQAGKASYLRFSIGQGFRFPSIAERFVDNDIASGLIAALPNPDVQPEYGFNSELGLKQGIKINKWLAYLDISLFWMEYWDMTDFVFGLHPPAGTPPGEFLDYLGFQVENVARARIAGYEVSLLADGKMGPIPMRFQGGYTYSYGVDLSRNPEYIHFGRFMKQLGKSLASKSLEVTDPLLKYRYRHLVKSDLEVDLHNFTFGTEFQIYGFIERVDPIFIAFIPGLQEERERTMNKPDWVWNMRYSYDFDKFGRLSLIVNNVLNREFDVRIARLEPPINFTVQYRVKF